MSNYQGGRHVHQTRPPLTEGKTKRFCPYCGRLVIDYFKKLRCPHGGCGRQYHPVIRPTLPKGQSYCTSCVEGVVKKDYCYCPLCHGITETGKKWKELVEENNKKKAELDRKVQEDLDKLLHPLGTDDELNSKPMSEDSELKRKKVKPNSEETSDKDMLSLTQKLETTAASNLSTGSNNENAPD